MSPDDLFYKEWIATKDLMDKFGDRIYDLRKYGFSFITAILTAQAILIPNNLPILPINQVINQGYVPNTIKFAVIIITILLIITLYFFEKSYQILMDAANSRALIIETKLNLELLETVSYHSNFKHVTSYNTGIYMLFIGSALILSYFTIPSFYLWTFFFGGLSIVGIVLIQLFPFSNRFECDWTINKVEFQKEELVEITCNYFGKHKIFPTEKDINQDEKAFNKKFAWKILNQDGECIYEESPLNSLGEPIKIPIKHNYTWFWDTSDIPEGIYQLLPCGWYFPLQRKIRIVDKNKSQ